MKLPQYLRDAAVKDDLLVASSARCESFPAQYQPAESEGLSCLVCTQPLVRDSRRYALGAIVGGTDSDRAAFRVHLARVMEESGLRLPDARLLVHGGFSMLLVSWALRGEMRAILAQAVSTWGGQETGAIPAGADFDARQEQQDQEEVGEAGGALGPQGWIGSLPGEASRSLDHRAFRQQLVEFGLAYDGPARAAIRKLLSPERARTWDFPLGCRVVEGQAGRRVTWTLQFEDLEMLERAHVLLNPVLQEMASLGSRLRPGDASIEDLSDDVTTQIPALCVTTDWNTRQARVEMVRLIKNLILTLDRLGLREESHSVLS